MESPFGDNTVQKFFNNQLSVLEESSIALLFSSQSYNRQQQKSIEEKLQEITRKLATATLKVENEILTVQLILNYVKNGFSLTQPLVDYLNFIYKNEKFYN
jgi:hypothetical protein